MDGRRREAVGDEDLHRERLDVEARAGCDAQTRAEGRRSEVGLVRGGLGGDLANRPERP